MNSAHLEQLKNWPWHVQYVPELYHNLSPQPADCPYIVIFQDASVGFFKVLPSGRMVYGCSEFITQADAQRIVRTCRGPRIYLNIDPRLRVSEGL